MKHMLDARALAARVLNISLASGKDSARPQTYGTLEFEAFDDAVRITASDNSILLTGLVPLASDPDGIHLPSIDEVPNESVVVMAHDGRLRSLMRYVLRDAKAAEKDGHEPAPVSIEVRSGERPSVPTLSPDLDRRIMVVTTDRERLDLDIYDGAFLHWRPLLARYSPEPTASVAFSPRLLAMFSKLRDAPEGIEFHLAGPTGGAQFSIDCDPPIDGLLMPVQMAPALLEVETGS